LIAWAITLSTAFAVPRYSAQYNQSCVLCHVNPSGGGARSLYGAQFFSYTELAAKETPFEEVERVQPMLNDQVQVGFDMRTMFYGTDQPPANSFLQMQGDLYVVFQFNPQWTLFVDKGLYNGFEIWGMGHILPYNGYVKAGRFVPPYGLRLADHKAFIRDKLGMGAAFRETGAEIGFHPQKFTLAVAVTNSTSQLIDTDETKAVTGRMDFRFPVSEVLVWVGTSERYQDISGVEDFIGGGYGGLNYGIFSVMGELDYRVTGEVSSLVGFVEGSVRLKRGVTLKTEYDFYDPDLDYQSGAESMVVVGAEIVPLGFLEFIPNVRYYDISPGDDNDYYVGEIQFHIFF
jgi:hypothetical protein